MMVGLRSLRALRQSVARICALLLLATVFVPSAGATSAMVSLDVDGAPLTSVVRILAMQSGQNVISDSSLNSIRVSLRLENVPISQALSVLSQAYGLVITNDHGVIIILTAASLHKRMEDQAEGDERVTVVHLKYARAEDAVKHLAVFLPERCFTADVALNSIVLIGGGAAITRARAVLDALDRKNQQVRFEVKVIDISLDDESNIGTIIGGEPSTPGSAMTAFQTAAIPLSAQINALVTRGRAKILATPRIVTTNNTEADLLIGESYPLVTTSATSTLSTQQVQYLDVGVKLRVLPTIGADGSILAELHPEYSSFESTSVQGYPIIANRRVDATLRVKNNESIVLAGLLQDVDAQTIARFPILCDIPILGGVFRNRQRSHHRDEVVFIITPHVL
jgi:type II secretory pathway component GspD/PulD (secretin)